jgi:hypothetical protein
LSQLFKPLEFGTVSVLRTESEVSELITVGGAGVIGVATGVASVGVRTAVGAGVGVVGVAEGVSVKVRGAADASGVSRRGAVEGAVLKVVGAVDTSGAVPVGVAKGVGATEVGVTVSVTGVLRGSRLEVGSSFCKGTMRGEDELP